MSPLHSAQECRQSEGDSIRNIRPYTARKSTCFRLDYGRSHSQLRIEHGSVTISRDSGSELRRYAYQAAEARASWKSGLALLLSSSSK